MSALYQLKKSVGGWSSGTVVEPIENLGYNTEDGQDYVLVQHSSSYLHFETTLDNLIKRRNRGRAV